MTTNKRNKSRKYNRKLKHKAFKINDYIKAVNGGLDLLNDNFKGNTKAFNTWIKDNKIDCNSRIERIVSNRLINSTYETLQEHKRQGNKIHIFGTYKKGYQAELDTKIDNYKLTLVNKK